MLPSPSDYVSVVVKESLWPFLLEALQMLPNKESKLIYSHTLPVLSNLQHLEPLVFWTGLVCTALRRRHSSYILKGNFAYDVEAEVYAGMFWMSGRGMWLFISSTPAGYNFFC
jgi:hypothetical protein